MKETAVFQGGSTKPVPSGRGGAGAYGKVALLETSESAYTTHPVPGSGAAATPRLPGLLLRIPAPPRPP